jgi:hypothetical protein
MTMYSVIPQTQVKNPGVDMPVGIVGCISFVSVIYSLLALVLVLMVPYDQIDTAASFSTAFTQVGYNWGQVSPAHVGLLQMCLLQPCLCERGLLLGIVRQLQQQWAVLQAPGHWYV